MGIGGEAAAAVAVAAGVTVWQRRAG